MMYRNPGDRTRSLMRLWTVEVYDGDKNKKKTKTRKETVFAWNHVDATRRVPGDVASIPEPVGWVTWPLSEGGPRYFIVNPKVGPTEVEANPSVKSESEEEWDF